MYSYFSLDDDTTQTITQEQQGETDEQLLSEIEPIKKIKIVHTVNFKFYFIMLFFICLIAFFNVFKQKRIVAKTVYTSI